MDQFLHIFLSIRRERIQRLPGVRFPILMRGLSIDFLEKSPKRLRISKSVIQGNLGNRVPGIQQILQAVAETQAHQKPGKPHPRLSLEIAGKISGRQIKFLSCVFQRDVLPIIPFQVSDDLGQALIFHICLWYGMSPLFEAADQDQ